MALINIAGKSYELILENKAGWNLEAFRNRYSEVLERYDYIVGDWGYNQLRLKGFFKEGSNKATKETTFAFATDYLNEYCNFGCAYFVLEKKSDTAEPDTTVDIDPLLADLDDIEQLEETAETEQQEQESDLTGDEVKPQLEIKNIKPQPNRNQKDKQEKVEKQDKQERQGQQKGQDKPFKRRPFKPRHKNNNNSNNQSNQSNQPNKANTDDTNKEQPKKNKRRPNRQFKQFDKKKNKEQVSTTQE